jgi:exopolysaccharide production protein ExoQ
MLARLLAITYLTGAAGLFANLLAGKSAGGEGGSSAAFVAAWLAVYVISAPFIIIRLLRQVVAGNIYLNDSIAVIFCVLVLAGSQWSAMPDQTFRYSISLVLNIMFSWYCARTFNLREFLTLLLWALNGMIIIGLILGLVGLPSAVYVDPLARANLLGTPLIQGLFTHKIYAGFYAAAAMILNICLLRGAKRMVACGVALLGVLLSGSSIGLVAAMFGCFTLILLRALRNLQLRIMSVPLVICFISLGAIGFGTLLDEATGALGRDMTLTGRTTIWGFAVKFWAEKPIFGWAYGGIFGDSPNAPGNIVRSNNWYVAPHFHNVYLQVAAEMGTVGFMLFMYVVLFGLFRAVLSSWSTRGDPELAFATCIIMILAIGFVMNISMRYNELSTLILFYAFFVIRRPSIDLMDSPNPASIATEPLMVTMGRKS